MLELELPVWEGGGPVELHPLIWHEWVDDGHLSNRSLIWIREHADEDDAHPLQTAIAQLRAGVEGF